ncbi:MAG: LysR family transcriptional regulator [Aquincola sp.]|nr:LysR family transcriptional regulator [Aquincola sp.]
MTPAAPPFSLRQLHYFVAAARAGQISAAAREANISQSAMTLALAELERLLGTQPQRRSIDSRRPRVPPACADRAGSGPRSRSLPLPPT